jgi:hypothetical protein
MRSGRLPPGDFCPEVEELPLRELRRRMEEEARLFFSLFCTDRGDRLAGEEGLPDPARCDLCGAEARLGRLLQSDYTLDWAILPGLVAARPVPVERPEDGLFWLCRRCWKPPH